MELVEPAGLVHHHCRVSTGLTLHVVERPGTGVPIVLLHGIWGMWRSWLRLLEEDAPGALGRPVYAIDLRGHGHSGHPKCGYTLADYAADIIAFLDYLPSRQATLVGHSLGALVALEVAATVPSWLDKLVLEEPPLPFPDENEPIDGFWQEFVEALFGFYILKHEPHDVIVDELLKAADWMTPELADEGAYYIAHTADGVLTAVMRQEITSESFGHTDQSLVMPALIFQGSIPEQRAVNDAGVEMLQNILARTKVVSIPDTGHIIHSNAVEEFQRELARFLSS